MKQVGFLIGALVAALSKHDGNAVPHAMIMLQELIHRGHQGHEIITPEATIAAGSLEELRKHIDTYSIAAIGHNASSSKKGTLDLNDLPAVLEGHIFNESATSCFTQIKTVPRQSPEKIARRLLSHFDGDYIFAIASAGRIVVGRDPLGTKPLYYGESEESCAVASERKALWKIGIHNVRSFPPGNIATMRQTGFFFRPVWTIKLRTPRRIGLSAAVTRLRALLEESIRERLRDVQNAGIAFSGGLDSSLVARLVQESGSTVHLVSVNMAGRHGLSHAAEAAKVLSLPITVQEYSIRDVENALPKVLWLIEEPDLGKAGIAIPLLWSAQLASRLGCDVLLAGQGADEMFGGYRRYLTIYEEKGVGAVAESLFHDTVMSYEMNFQRDEPLCAFSGIELRLPFVDTKLVRFALSLPVDLKIESAYDPLRKRILRQLAKDLDIPTSIAERPKKAIQFETGVDKALRDLAKSKNLAPREYVEEIYKTVHLRSGSDLN